MKKNIRFIIIIFFIISAGLLSHKTAYSSVKKANSDTKSEIKLTPLYDKSSGLYGYVDKKGKWILEPQFMMAKPFSEGLAAVSEDSEAPKWGYILPDGTYAIKPKYMAAYEFKNNFAIVADDNFYVSTIDKKGKVIQASKYYIAQGNLEYIRATISDKLTFITGSDNIKYGVITNSGKFIKPQFDNIPDYMDPFVCFFKEDASREVSKRTHFILMSNGTITNIPGYIASVSEGVGLIEYSDKKYPERSTLYAYVTSKGKVVKDYTDYSKKIYPFIVAKDFSEGYGVVKINIGNGDSYFDQWGFLKKDGTWLVDPTYTYADSFNNGVAPVKIFLTDSWGYIKGDLTWFIEPFSPSEEQLKIEKDYCIKEAKSILKNIINDSMSDYEKLDCIYQYVTSTIVYDNLNTVNIPRASGSAYGAFKYKLAICSGFALSLDIMLELAGFEDIVVSGTLSSIGHAWNLVKLNGNYYHLDPTTDAANGNHKTLFLVSDDKLSKSHTWNKEDYPAARKNYK